jgi:hypothetical protein
MVDCIKFNEELEDEDTSSGEYSIKILYNYSMKLMPLLRWEETQIKQDMSRKILLLIS